VLVLFFVVFLVFRILFFVFLKIVCPTVNDFFVSV
jgi:hypothetical protein